MRLALLDVDVYKKGRLAVDPLLALAQDAGVDTPRLLRHGKIDAAFLDQVRRGELAGVTEEGIIGKGPVRQQEGGPVMFKHKTQAWFDRLKDRCGEDTAMFERLR
jgi:hypothetical protein